MPRTLLRTLAAVTGLAAPLAVATPASAAGEGCVGLQSNPLAFVCVVSLDPAALPDAGTSGSATVFDDTVCYLAGCRDVTVTVPTVGVTWPTDPVLVVSHNGTTYSVGLTGVPSVPPVPPVPNLTPYTSPALGLAEDVTEDVVERYRNIDTTLWADCTVESATDDRVDLSGSSWFSGYTPQECTSRWLLGED